MTYDKRRRDGRENEEDNQQSFFSYHDNDDDDEHVDDGSQATGRLLGTGATDNSVSGAPGNTSTTLAIVTVSSTMKECRDFDFVWK